MRGAILESMPQNEPQIRVHRSGVGVIQSPRRHTDVVGDRAEFGLLAGQRSQ